MYHLLSSNSMRSGNCFKMKLIYCLLFFVLIEMHNARKKVPSNVLRIPLRTIRPRRQDDPTEQSKSVVLDDTHDLNLGRISIGEPKQDFDVVVDTGSLELWVFSSNYDTCDPFSQRVFRKQKLYNRLSSTSYSQPLSYKKQPKAQLINYALQWVFGFRATDTVSIGGKKIKKEFLEVTKSTKYRAYAAPNGIMGLKYDPKTGNIATKFCDKIHGEHKFSFYLPKIKWGPKGTKGELLLCGEDQSKYKEGTMKYLNEQTHGLWTIAMKKVTVETEEEVYTITTGNSALVDTGASVIGAPLKYMTRFFNEAKNLFDGYAEKKTIDCTKRHLLPPLSFYNAAEKFTLTGMEYTRNIFNACSVAIRAINMPNWILGEPFLRKYYTVFDMKNHKIGFAESKG